MLNTSRQQKHTVRRGGNLYYNRRVPVHAQRSYGKIIRIKLDDEASADLLTQRLDAIWQQGDTGTAVNLLSLLGATNTRPRKLSEIAEEYVGLKGIQENPTISSVMMLAELSGDIAVDAYIRQDARNFVASLMSQGNRTTSIRRRLNCLTAVFNYAYSEYDYSGQNPFSQVRIPKEGTDATRRIPFDVGELGKLYKSAMTSGKRLRMAAPILGETGCRIAEVIGLRISDIAEDYHSIRIVAHPARRLKTPCSTRTLPLVGQARVAMRLLVENSASDYLFPEYLREAFGYEDGWQATDGVFLYTGQGQIGDMEFVRGNKAIRDHIADGKQLFLFKATGKGKPVEFIGEFECASIDFASGPDFNGSTRKTIRFNLTPLNSIHSVDIEEVEPEIVLPARTFEQMRQSAFDAITPTETPNWRMAKQIRRQRSSEIKEYVLRRANGICELTAEKAPFAKANGQPYLEVHHIKKLSDGGLDHPVNCAAITPNAHREIHFGANGELLDERLASLIRSKEKLLSEG